MLIIGPAKKKNHLMKKAKLCKISSEHAAPMASGNLLPVVVALSAYLEIKSPSTSVINQAHMVKEHVSCIKYTLLQSIDSDVVF